MSDDHLAAELRLACRFRGCDGSPYCERCGKDLYDPDYITYGYFDPLVSLYWRVRRWLKVDKRCGVDNCLLKRGHDGEHDDIPF